MSSPSRVSNTAVYAVLTIGAVITLSPFLLGLLTSFTSAHQFATGTPLQLPRPPTLANYADIADAGFRRAAVVTALMTAVILLGHHQIQRHHGHRPRHHQGCDVDPEQRNTFWALVLPFMFGSPYAIFLLREHFRLIPDDLINAARLDGANTLDVIVHVVIPSSRPVLAALAMITVVSQWNNFMWPLVITSGHKWRVLTVATADLQSRFNDQWTLVMAATTVAIVPLIALFVTFQRHIVASIVVSGLK